MQKPSPLGYIADAFIYKSKLSKNNYYVESYKVNKSEVYLIHISFSCYLWLSCCSTAMDCSSHILTTSRRLLLMCWHKETCVGPSVHWGSLSSPPHVYCIFLAWHLVTANLSMLWSRASWTSSSVLGQGSKYENFFFQTPGLVQYVS